MQTLLHFVTSHQGTLGILGALVTSAAVRALPEPSGKNSFYKWAFDFTHLLLANFDKVGKREA